MEKEAREAYYLKEYLEDGFQVYEAENEEGSKVKITLTGEIAERLPYGLRSWLKNKTGYGSRKAEIALVDWKDADKISEAYCF
jgi:hypothetical protein